MKKIFIIMSIIAITLIGCSNSYTQKYLGYKTETITSNILCNTDSLIVLATISLSYPIFEGNSFLETSLNQFIYTENNQYQIYLNTRKDFACKRDIEIHNMSKTFADTCSSSISSEIMLREFVPPLLQ